MKSSKVEGVPQSLTPKTAREWAEPRVSKKRFKHIEGVAAVAAEIATLAKEDVQLAEIAGWLHDACKEIKSSELVKIAETMGLSVNDIERANGHLLHGPVASMVAKQELGIDNQDLLDAIAEHTLGRPNMTRLSQVVFLADCLEESRPDEFTKPIWKALHKVDSDKQLDAQLDAQLNEQVKGAESKANLDLAMLVACDLSLKGLIDDRRAIHPLTIETRNYFLARVAAAKT